MGCQGLARHLVVSSARSSAPLGKEKMRWDIEEGTSPDLRGSGKVPGVAKSKPSTGDEKGLSRRKAGIACTKVLGQGLPTVH